MARKPTKGYFVKGHFVAAGSELDLELKRERKGDLDSSKTERKKHSEQVQRLGTALLDLRSGLLATLALPDALLDALEEARRISDFEGRRRQLQFIGKLMRKLDPALLQTIEHALEVQHQGSAADTLRLHQAEQWRERLLADDAALDDWLQLAPDTDVQHLRTLLRQARKDALAAVGAAGAAVRQGRSYRELFQLVRKALDAQDCAQERAQPAPALP